jgi:hypothetical protein
MNLVELKLEELISKNIDSISGRTTGQNYAQDKKIMDSIDSTKYVIIISPKIKAINDSFIKGFFSEVFKKYRTKEKVQEKFTVQGEAYFVDLFNKNFSILESISNS